MPYCETNPQCGACVCPSCSRFRTGDCLQGATACDRCDNIWYTRKCVWDTNGEKGESEKEG